MRRSTGNVLTNDLHPNGQPGADTPRSFVSWNGSTTATYGTFVANPDGTYSYTLNTAMRWFRVSMTASRCRDVHLHDAGRGRRHRHGDADDHDHGC